MEDLDKLDEVFRNGLQNAKLSPPPGVWEGIAASAATSSTAAGTASFIAGKWLVAILSASVVGVVAYFTSSTWNDNSLKENTKAQGQSHSPSKSDSEFENTPQPTSGNPSDAGFETQNSDGSAIERTEKANQTNAENSGLSFGPDDLQKPNGNIEVNRKSVADMPPSHTGRTESVNPCKGTLELTVQKITHTAYSFSAKNPKGNITWYFGDGNSLQGFEAAHNFADIPAKYVVRAYSKSLDPVCNDSAFYTLVIPGPKPVLTNVFTPNGDGFNDAYYVDVKNTEMYDLTILDMQNRPVFSTKNPDVHWDGSCRNIQCPEGKYQVLFTYQYPGETHPTVLREILVLTRGAGE